MDSTKRPKDVARQSLVPELLLVGSYLHVDYRIIKLSFAVNNIS
jgi:hypothetical protein